jgi:large subunit ribosomal protein L25
MTEVHTLRVEARERAGKGAARATRRDGRVPAVIYGNKETPQLVSIAPLDLSRELQKKAFYATLFDLELGSKKIRVLPRDVQFDPVSDRAIHADFLRVGAGTKVRVQIPVKFLNDTIAPGIKRGGVLNIVRHEIEFVCDADNIPPLIEVDLDGLDIGDSVHISMVKLPAGIRPTITERDFTIASIAAPTAQKIEAQEAAAAAAAAAAAPAAAEGAAPAAGAAPGAAPGAAAPAAGAKPAAGAAAPAAGAKPAAAAKPAGGDKKK